MVRKMYEELAKVKPTYVMHLPNTSKGEFAYKLWKDEMIRLKEEVEKSLGVTITEEDIRAAIKDKNEERELLKSFMHLVNYNHLHLQALSYIMFYIKQVLNLTVQNLNIL